MIFRLIETILSFAERIIRLIGQLCRLVGAQTPAATGAAAAAPV